jgi:hypothetical protein
MSRRFPTKFNEGVLEEEAELYSSYVQQPVLERAKITVFKFDSWDNYQKIAIVQTELRNKLNKKITDIVQK